MPPGVARKQPGRGEEAPPYAAAGAVKPARRTPVPCHRRDWRPRSARTRLDTTVSPRSERLQSLHRAFASAVKRAKLPADLRQHDLRHRRVTTWLAEGKSPVLVQRAMGHADLATTMGYAHLVDHDLLALVKEPADEALRALADG